jgi:hypothetical protein
MENLGHEVVEAAQEAVSSSAACPIKKALPIIVPLGVLVGFGFLLVKVVKGRKAKKATTPTAPTVETPAE